MAKRIYIEGFKKLVNSFNNSDFSNEISGWKPTDYASSYSIKDKIISLTMKSTQTDTKWILMTDSTNYTTVTNHIYYYSCKFRKTGTTSSNVGLMISANLVEVVPSTTWTKLSSRQKATSTTTNFFVYATFELNDILEITEVLKYDLTEAFGAGNEPTIEWCDENLVEGYELPLGEVARKVKKAYMGVDDVTRKVKKGYIGVNDVARLFYSSIEPQTITNFSTPNFTASTYIDEFGSEWTVSPSTAYTAWDNDDSTYYTGSASNTTRLTLTLPDGYYLTPNRFWYTIRYCSWVLYGVTADGTEYSIATGANGGTGTVYSYTDILTSNQREYVKFYLDISSYNGSTAPQMKEAYFSSSTLRIE